MKKIYPLSFTFLLCCIAAFAQPYLKPSLVNTTGEPHKTTFWDVQSAFENYWQGRTPSNDERENAEAGGWQQFKRWEAFMMQRTFPSGVFPNPNILFNEYQKYKLSSGNQIQTANWNFIGPHVVPSDGGGTGRVNCIAFNPTNANIIWLGAACGGLWKSIDGGLTWTSNTDLLPSLSISEIVFDPSNANTMYIATGDKYGVYYGYEVWGHYSAGVMKSTDGGVTWNQSGMNFNQWNGELIQRLIIDSNNPTTLFAATYSGIYRTTNGGTSWTNLRTGPYYDLEFNPGNHTIMYVGDSLGALRSTDSGVSWTRINGITGSGRSTIAVTPANANIVYVWTEGGGFYYSNNGGTTFSTRVDPVGTAGPYGYYDYVLCVSPVDENLLFTGGLNIAKSTNGGNAWTSASTTNYPAANYVHADNHDLSFAPGSAQTVYSCNDGGFFKTNNLGTAWTDLSGGIDIKQYYRMSSSQQSASIMYAGAQDNGSDKITGLNNAQQVNGADGEDCLVDWFNDQVVFVSSQGGYFLRSTNGGNSFSGISGSGSDWTSPIRMDPNNHNIVYIGGTDIDKSTDNGSSWNNMGGSFNGAIYSLEVAPSNSNYIYAATFSGVYRTTTGSAPFTNITGTIPVANAAISGLAIDAADANRVWVTLSGYSAGNKVFQSDNGGVTWVNISGTLPNVPVNCIQYQANSSDNVYIGTDLGVFYEDATMNDWITYNTGLPNVIIDDLEVYFPTSKIRAATFGRGIWESDLNTSTLIALDAGTPAIVSPAGDYCDSVVIPVIRIRNYGVTTLTSLNVYYRLDSNPNQIYAWSGSMPSLATADITLAPITVGPGAHTYTAYTSDPNGGVDGNTLNDSRVSNFNINTIGIPAPVIEGFVTTAFPPGLWTVENSSGIWSRFASAGGWGLSNECARADCYSVLAGNIDMMISPTMNFTNLVSPVTVDFDVAHAVYPGYVDSLAVSISADCGVTFNRVYAKGGATLATAPSTMNQFVPAPTEWRAESVNLDAYIGNPGVTIRFEAISGYGNYLYVDNINIHDGLTGIPSIANESYVTVFPNPSSDVLNVEVNSMKNENLNISVFDVIGNKISFIADKKSSGLKRYRLNLSQFAKGIYFVKVMMGEEMFTRKVTVMK